MQLQQNADMATEEKILSHLRDLEEVSKAEVYQRIVSMLMNYIILKRIIVRRKAAAKRKVNQKFKLYRSAQIMNKQIKNISITMPEIMLGCSKNMKSQLTVQEYLCDLKDLRN